MAKRILVSLAIIMMCAGPAFADATSVVKAQSEAFNKAFTSCDVPAVLALYQDDATIIWPGQGAVATGKEAIEKVVKASCSGAKPSLKELSSESRAIGRDYIINVGMWDAAGTGPDGRPTNMRIRTSELLHRSGGKWRYVVDHASVGMMPARNAAAKEERPH